MCVWMDVYMCMETNVNSHSSSFIVLNRVSHRSWSSLTDHWAAGTLAFVWAQAGVKDACPHAQFLSTAPGDPHSGLHSWAPGLLPIEPAPRAQVCISLKSTVSIRKQPLSTKAFSQKSISFNHQTPTHLLFNFGDLYSPESLSDYLLNSCSLLLKAKWKRGAGKAAWSQVWKEGHTFNPSI